MRAVVDTSSWISLARAGLLSLIPLVPIEPLLTDVVHREAIEEGTAGGHPDARAIASTAGGLSIMKTPDGPSADDAVLRAAQAAGTLVANDVALGRRARSLGVRWLRSADLVVLAVRSRRLEAEEGRRAVEALTAAGRITPELADAYRQELR